MNNEDLADFNQMWYAENVGPVRRKNKIKMRHENKRGALSALNTNTQLRNHEGHLVCVIIWLDSFWLLACGTHNSLMISYR